MRPASPADRGAVADLIRARRAWMTQRSLSLRHGAHVLDLVAESGEPTDPPLVWLLAEDDQAVAVTLLHTGTPPTGWTAEQQSQPAVFLSSTITHPAHRLEQPSRLIALWAVDYAARQLSGVHWVRCAAPAAPVRDKYLAYRWEQAGRRGPAFLMQQPVRLLPGLSAFITTEQSA